MPRCPGRAAAVLSGGAGTRIGGREKGLLPCGGITFIEKKIADIEVVFSSIFIVTAKPELYRFLEKRVRVVEDFVEGGGALGGIYTALRAAEAEGGDLPGAVFITTSDTPFLVPELARVLFDEAAKGGFDVFIPRWKGMIEPLCGVYTLRCIPAIEEILPRRKIRLFYPRVRTGYLPEEKIREIDPEGKSFININTEEDYIRYIGAVL
ncbi:MAG: molybdenum cofactor guanylyltransferase [Spirochaetia bacterium]